MRNIKVKYLSGFPEYSSQDMEIDFGENKLTFIPRGFLNTKPSITIPSTNIIEVSFNQDSHRSGGKAAAGAIVGGLLTGGIGLLAGAAFGGRRKKQNHLNMMVLYEDHECVLEFKPTNELKDVYTEIRSLMRHNENTLSANPQMNASDTTAALAELFELKEKGALTPEEFQEAKKKLLGM
jgi:hypothetical protein